MTMKWTATAQARVCMLIDRDRLDAHLFNRMITACELRARRQHGATLSEAMVISSDVEYFERMWSL